jgi:hypothetical protein
MVAGLTGRRRNRNSAVARLFRDYTAGLSTSVDFERLPGTVHSATLFRRGHRDKRNCGPHLTRHL